MAPRKSSASRIYGKNGEKNITQKNISQKSVKFFKDFATTLIEGQWRYTLAVFAMSFVGSWTIFAALWQLVAHAHGDLDFDQVTGERLGDGDAACTRGAHDFAGFFLLSVETQVTTGYGEKYPSEECPEAMFLLMVQLVIGVVIEGAMVGVVYAKLTRPPRHFGDRVFSRNCVICTRDGVLCLLFRISNRAQHQEIDSRVEMFLCDKNSLECRDEEENSPNYKLNLENDGKITLYLPQIVAHYITEDSPLYDYSAADILQANFEILVTLTGSSKATGHTSQSRTSYLASEILWGYRFINIINYDRHLESYTIDQKKFNTVQYVDTPLCSARRLDHIRSDDRKQSFHTNYNVQMNLQVGEIGVTRSLESI